MAIRIEHNRSSGVSGGGSISSSRSSSSTRSSVSFSANSILKILMLLLLFFSFFSLMIGHGYHFSLQTLLETLTNLPKVDISAFTEKITIPTITADWGVFSPISAFLNVVINILNTTVSFVVFLGTGFAQVLMLVTALLSGL